MNCRAVAIALAVFVALAARARAHNEFQQFVRKNSGRAVDCALCHIHSNGPEGTGAGQVGSLSAEELSRLGRARGAFEPGANVDSPILNDFGDFILELRSAPGQLTAELGFESDLDSDGIPDAREYLEGTHPLLASDGDPWSLFVHNLGRHAFQLTMITVATLITLFGLVNLLHGFAARFRTKEPVEEGASA
jgi:hypothetical protein